MDGLRTGRREHLNFVVLVALAYLSLLGLPKGALSPGRVLLLLAAGAAYAAVGTAGFAVVERAPTRRGTLLYFAVQIPLAATICLLTGIANATALVLLPPAAQAVRVLPRRGVAVVCLLLVAGVAMPTLLLYGDIGPGRALQSAITLLAAVGFAVVLSQVAVSEQRARARAQALAAELDEANRRLREYAAQAEESATIWERNRLAREIHDGLGHYLTAIHMQI